jgi:hypothetical protein
LVGWCAYRLILRISISFSRRMRSLSSRFCIFCSKSWKHPILSHNHIPSHGLFVSITDVSFVDEWKDNHVLIFYTNIYCYHCNRTAILHFYFFDLCVNLRLI